MTFSTEAWLKKNYKMTTRLEERCPIFSLRVISLLVGYLGAVIYAVVAILSFVLASGIAYFLFNTYDLKDIFDEREEVYEALLGLGSGFSIGLCMLCAMCSGFYITLLVGVHQKIPNRVKSWTTFQTVFIVANVIPMSALIVQGLKYDLRFLVACTLYTVWNVFSWAVVNSYHMQLKQQGIIDTNIKPNPELTLAKSEEESQITLMVQKVYSLNYFKACLIIGFLGAIVCLICLFVNTLLLLCMLFIKSPAELIKMIFSTYPGYFKENPYIYHIMDHLGISGFIVLFLIFAIFLGFYIILLIGVYQEKASHLHAWLSFKKVFMFSNSVNFMIVTVVLTIYFNSYYYYANRQGVMAGLILWMVYNVLSWIIVKCYYNQLIKKEEDVSAYIDTSDKSELYQESKMVSIVTKICCCCNLKTACYFIGYFEGVFIMFWTFISTTLVAVFCYFEVNVNVLDYYTRDIQPSTFEHSRYAIPLTCTLTLATSIVLFILSATCLSFYIALLVGLHKQKPNHLKNWTIFKMVAIVLLFGITFIISILFTHYVTGFFEIRIMAVGLIFAVINLFSWAVVRSHYQQMKNGIHGSYQKLDEAVKLATP